MEPWFVNQTQNSEDSHFTASLPQQQPISSVNSESMLIQNLNSNNESSEIRHFANCFNQRNRNG